MSQNSYDSTKSLPKQSGIDSFLVGTIAVTIFILGAVVYFGLKAGTTAKVITDSQVELVANDTQYDWGTISMANGIVNKSFTIANPSDAPLKLYDVKTSCMCTTAQLKTASQTSKKFGMHEKNSNVFEINPGETAELFVEYDPAFHGPSGIGPISRTITMDTNDPDQPTLSFLVTANVVNK